MVTIKTYPIVGFKKYPINNLCLSVVHSFKIGRVQLSLPSDCMPIEFKHLGKNDGNL